MSSQGLFNDPVLNQLRECALLAVDLSISGQGCNDNGCICQQEYLPAVVTAVSTAVQGQCSSSNTIDAFSAMAAVISYCTAHGYPAPALLASITTPTANTQTISLLSSPEVTELPSCAMIPIGYAYGSIGCRTNNCLCRPDLMAPLLDVVSTSASAACSGVAAAGVNSALAAISIYCSRAGFAVSATFSSEPTGTITNVSPEQTTTVPATTSFLVLPGGSSSPILPTSSASTTSGTSTSNSSSHNLQIILPVTIACLAVLLIGAFILRKLIHQNTPNNPAVDHRTPVEIFKNAKHIHISGAQFTTVGGNQFN